MSTPAESSLTLSSLEIASIADALAMAAPLAAVLGVVDRIAMHRIGTIVFSASLCRVDAMEVERIYSSRPQAYAVGVRTNKRQTAWGRQVLQEQKVFVGEGALEMAAAFDDKEGMASIGVRSIINVPIVVQGRCLGVLNFGRGVERVSPSDVTIARFLSLAACPAFLATPA
ncbi:MAG: GAF domain-containing protein [Caldimonas sp.]|nr:GAF domain-containing protein [Pseudomonadota bacterium]